MPFNLSIYDILGVSLLFFGGIWVLYGLYLIIRKPESRLGGVIITLISLVGLGAFVFLTASTNTRRAYINLDMRGLFSALVGFALAAALALGLALAIYWLANRLNGARSAGIRFAAAVSVGMILFMTPVMAWLYSSTFAPDLDEMFLEVETVEGVRVEENIPIKIFESEHVQAPSSMTLGENGELYVAGTGGTIWVMDDPNLDGVADNVRVFASDVPQPAGLAWGEDGLFVNAEGKTILLQDTDDDGAADTEKVIVDGFPGEIYAFHQNNGLTFGPDGRLYIGSGSTSDSDPETNDMAARIFSVNPDGSDLRVYATGTRNPFGLIPAPGGGFFASDNGSSGCVPDTDCKEKMDVPEEVNFILEGKDYGFPNYFGMPPEDSGTMPPVVTFPEHSAPTGLAIYDGDKFPERFKGQLFVALWAQGEIYRVKLYKVDDEHFIGSPLRFASGLIGPTAIVNSPDGGLYVASYSGNAIYHIG